MKNKRLIRKEIMKRNNLTRAIAVVLILTAIVVLAVNYSSATTKINPKVLSQSPPEYTPVSIEDLENYGIKLQKGDNLIQLPDYFFEQKLEFKKLFNSAVLRNLDYVQYSYPGDDDINAQKTLYYLYSSQKKTSLKNSGEIETSKNVLYPMINIRMNKDAVWKVDPKILESYDSEYYDYKFVEGNNLVILPSSGFKDWYYLQFLGNAAKNVYAIKDDNTKTTWRVPDDWMMRVATAKYVENGQWDNQIKNPVLWVYAVGPASIKHKIPAEKLEAWNESHAGLGNWSDTGVPQIKMRSFIEILKTDLNPPQKSSFVIVLQTLGDKIYDYYEKLTSKELDVLDGSIQVGNRTFYYTEEISFENMQNSGMWVYEKNKDPDGDSLFEEVYHYLKFAGKNSGDHLFDYKLTFTEPLDADIRELPGTVIKILGKEYVIGLATLDVKNSNRLQLSLFSWDKKTVAPEGGIIRIISSRDTPAVYVARVYKSGQEDLVDLTYLINSKTNVTVTGVRELEEIDIDYQDNFSKMKYSIGVMGDIDPVEGTMDLFMRGFFKLSLSDDLSDLKYESNLMVNQLKNQNTGFVRIQGGSNTSPYEERINITSIEYYNIADFSPGFWVSAGWTLSDSTYYNSDDSNILTKGYLLGIDYGCDTEYIDWMDYPDDVSEEDEIETMTVNISIGSYR